MFALNYFSDYLYFWQLTKGDSSSIRSYIQSMAILIFERNPLGIGYAQTENLVYYAGDFYNPHSIYLSILLSCGLFGLLLTAFIGIRLFLNIKNFLNSKTLSTAGSAYKVLASIATFYCLFGLTHDISRNMLMWVSISIIAAPLNEKVRSHLR